MIDPTELPLPPNPYLLEIDPPYATGYEVQPNQVLVFPFILGQNQRIIFNVRHTANYVQDYSLACWFSTKPYDPVLYYPNREIKTSLLKRMNLHFALQDENYTGSQQVPPGAIGVRYILETPGIYYYNVENQTGHLNKFDFIFQTVDLGP